MTAVSLGRKLQVNSSSVLKDKILNQRDRHTERHGTGQGDPAAPHGSIRALTIFYKRVDAALSCATRHRAANRNHTGPPPTSKPSPQNSAGSRFLVKQEKPD